ncbi:tetratricopeptide repeat protein [Sulfuricurvum sp.]|uniref:tetratricopeptide repeat protein n=1 Tax=Sulfuricurvum sp. TaxID=2025608 RepID=UPI0025DE8ABA|nr:tetratricopeptide repeat protein [Sulfuricurvum sp.]
MKNKQLPFILSILFCSVSLFSGQQNTSDEAYRYIVRGKMAEEMAKQTGEYDSAIQEYTTAIRIAPDWSDPYYRLGVVQEKSGKLRDAIASYNQYLQLSPNAPDAAKIRDHIYELEYKAEQILSIPDIVDILTSSPILSPDEWDYSATKMTNGRECRRIWSELYFSRESSDTVKVLRSLQYYPSRTYYQFLKVTGNTLKYITTINVCDETANIQDGGCDSIIENEIEVVSKKLVKVNQNVLRGGSGAGAGTGDKYSCTFRKK